MRETSYVHVYCTISKFHPNMLNMTLSPAVVCVPFALMSEIRHRSLSYTWHAQNTFRWIALSSTNFFVDLYFFSLTTTSPYSIPSHWSRVHHKSRPPMCNFLWVGNLSTLDLDLSAKDGDDVNTIQLKQPGACISEKTLFMSVKTVSVILETWSLYVICHLQIIQHLGLHLEAITYVR